MAQNFVATGWAISKITDSNSNPWLRNYTGKLAGGDDIDRGDGGEGDESGGRNDHSDGWWQWRWWWDCSGGGGDGVSDGGDGDGGVDSNGSDSGSGGGMAVT